MDTSNLTSSPTLDPLPYNFINELLDHIDDVDITIHLLQSLCDLDRVDSMGHSRMMRDSNHQIPNKITDNILILSPEYCSPTPPQRDYYYPDDITSTHSNSEVNCHKELQNYIFSNITSLSYCTRMSWLEKPDTELMLCDVVLNLVLKHHLSHITSLTLFIRRSIHHRYPSYETLKCQLPKILEGLRALEELDLQIDPFYMKPDTRSNTSVHSMDPQDYINNNVNYIRDIFHYTSAHTKLKTIHFVNEEDHDFNNNSGEDDNKSNSNCNGSEFNDNPPCFGHGNSLGNNNQPSVDANMTHSYEEVSTTFSKKSLFEKQQETTRAENFLYLSTILTPSSFPSLSSIHLDRQVLYSDSNVDRLSKLLNNYRDFMVYIHWPFDPTRPKYLSKQLFEKSSLSLLSRIDSFILSVKDDDDEETMRLMMQSDHFRLKKGLRDNTGAWEAADYLDTINNYTSRRHSDLLSTKNDPNVTYQLQKLESCDYHDNEVKEEILFDLNQVTATPSYIKISVCFDDLFQNRNAIENDDDNDYYYGMNEFVRDETNQKIYDQQLQREIEEKSTKSHLSNEENSYETAFSYYYSLPGTSDCREEEDNHSKQSDRGASLSHILSNSPGLTSLQHLDLSQCGLCDNCVESITKSPFFHNLTTLNLDSNPDITNLGLQHLFSSLNNENSSLRVLHLEGTRTNIQGLTHALSYDKLEEITINVGIVSDCDINELISFYTKAGEEDYDEQNRQEKSSTIKNINVNTGNLTKLRCASLTLKTMIISYSNLCRFIRIDAIFKLMSRIKFEDLVVWNDLEDEVFWDGHFSVTHENKKRYYHLIQRNIGDRVQFMVDFRM